ncbi:MAG TPA: protein kinase [Gemmatimonadaceae bacterium]
MPTVERLSSALADRYRIERELGQGGMATVYLAEDLRHKRKVALKVLKPELAAVLGADRFVQEITTTAALQHPHILPLFDSGTADGFLYYVMPFIKGETLRAKLTRERQLGVDEAVRIAREVADALDYAHRNGVIHRDIKPENILLHDGRPMVADFGIALAVSAAAGGRMTETGLSLGTPHYMSPEQATAEREISARSDVYSLASVLYETLAGVPPHEGGTAQQTIMRILTDTPRPVSELRKSVPPNVNAAILKALEKLPADRFESAKEFATALANPAFAGHPVRARPVVTRPVWNRATVLMTGVSTVLAILLLNGMRDRGPAPDDAAPVVRFTLSSDVSLNIAAGSTRPFAISPDGRTIVFRASTDSTPPQLWVRTIDDPRPRRIDGTEDGQNAAISPDGQTIAFIAQTRQLRSVPIGGGPVRTIANLSFVTAALTWASNDEILFETLTPSEGIYRVAAGGGIPQRAVPHDSAAGETRQRRPFMLRKAGVVAYGSTVGTDTLEEIVLYRLADGRRLRTKLAGLGALALIDDHLVYAGAQGEMKAVRLSADGMEVRGQPTTLSTRVGFGWTGSYVGVSEDGRVLVYRSQQALSGARLELVDTSGVRRLLPGTHGVVGTPRFSPSGRQVVVGLAASGMFGRRAGVASADLWLIDVASGEPTRLTSDASSVSPSFADGRRIVYSGGGTEGNPQLSTVPVDGSAPPSRLLALRDFPRYSSMAPDGKSVLVTTSRLSASLLRGWLDGSDRIDTLVKVQADQIRPDDPKVSPDGRWVAFIERSSGDVWVRSLTGPGLLQVSLKGTEGNPVVWGPDSKRLYYANTEGLHAIELETTPTLSVLKRRVIGPFPAVTDYDLSPDGHTFIVVSPVGATSDVIVVVNWVDEARRAWTRPPSK